MNLTLGMRYPFQRLSDTNAPYAEALMKAARRVVESGWYLLGNETEALERELAAFTGTNHAIGTANGLEAIRLIFRALIELGRLRPGDSVLVPANTFIASVLPLTQLGLVVRLVDPDPATMSVSLSAMAQAADADTRAVLAVHLYGYPAYDREGFDALRAKGIILVEDNAQAIGAEVFDPVDEIWKRTGSLGLASAVSFYPAKNIGALGDAGAVATSDDELADTVRCLANYGGAVKYHYPLQGYNSRIDEMQAAFLRVKLPYAVRERERREATARAYDEAVSNPGVVLPPRQAGLRQAWHQYVVRCVDRDRLARFLAGHGVETMIHYPVPPHRQECYAGVFPERFPVADRLAGEVLSLPIANVSSSEAREIASFINSFE